MPPVPQQVLIPDDLPSAKSPERAAIHQAALKWSILAPIIIRSQEDVKSRVRWAADLEPFLHQYENLYTFCRRLPVSLIADDVGLGKTVSAGLILSELMMRQRVRRTLVLCPKILCPQWEAELRTKFGIAAHACTGAKDLETAIRADHPVVITTNHSALSVLPTISNDQFEMLILDEAHKLRNLHGTSTPPNHPAVWTTEAILRAGQAAIVFTGLPAGTRDNRTNVTIQLDNGAPFQLVVGDHFMIWRAHQQTQDRTSDFDTLFEILSGAPGEHHYVTVV